MAVIRGIIGRQAGDAGRMIAILRAQSGIMVTSSRKKREVLPEHCRELKTPTPNERFDAKVETETNAWAEVAQQNDR